MELNKLQKYAELLPEYIVSSRADKCPSRGEVETIRWQFPNRHGASLACHNMTYGRHPELAVTYESTIVYDSGITSDVIGWIESPSEVALILARIRGINTKLDNQPEL